MAMAEQRRQYTAEFKRQAVDMLNSGKSGREVEKELGIGTGMAYRWRRERKELRDVREERDILAKAVAFFSKDPKRRSGS